MSMVAWFEAVAALFILGWGIHAERQAREAKDAAHRAGLQALRARQAADDSERAAYGTVRHG